MKNAQLQHGVLGKRLIVSISRLVSKNNFDLMIEALPEILKIHNDMVWIVIGDGPLRDTLIQKAEARSVSEHIVWLGAIYEEADIAPWLMNSELLVHPGSIGLTLLHAFGYGLPVITHDNADNHMPEFEAFEANKTGRLFVEGNATSLANTVNEMLSHPNKLVRMQEIVRAIACNEYNVDRMVDAFTRAVI